MRFDADQACDRNGVRSRHAQPAVRRSAFDPSRLGETAVAASAFGDVFDAQGIGHKGNVDITNTIPVKCFVEMINAPTSSIWQFTRMKVGSRVRQLRKARAGLTQVRLAAELGWERGTLAAVESGGSMPGRELVEALAGYFGVSVDFLLGREETSDISPLNEREREVVELFRRSPEPAKESVLGLLKVTAGAH